jgi:hypothetical protein
VRTHFVWVCPSECKRKIILDFREEIARQETEVGERDGIVHPFKKYLRLPTSSKTETKQRGISTLTSAEIFNAAIHLNKAWKLYLCMCDFENADSPVLFLLDSGHMDAGEIAHHYSNI